MVLGAFFGQNRQNIVIQTKTRLIHFLAIFELSVNFFPSEYKKYSYHNLLPLLR